jgi:hypothetical protein
VILRLVGVLSHFNYLEDARNHKPMIYSLCMIESRDVKLAEMLSHGTDDKCAQNPPLLPPRVGGSIQVQVRKFSRSQHFWHVCALIILAIRIFLLFWSIFHRRSYYFVLLFAWDDTFRSLATSPVWPLFLVLLS